MVVNTDGQANGAVVMLGEVREASTGIDDIAVVAQVIFAGLRASMIWNSSRRAVLAACPANITELRNAGINRMVDSKIE